METIVFLAKIPFLAFSHYHGNHFAKFSAHVLSWVKTYHHAEFQRNPPTCLAGMIVQTYRQTDKFCIFPDMSLSIKPSWDGGKYITKREVAKISFLALSHYHGNHFAKFLCHLLSWVKTYHAEFQRNLRTGLARMMKQTDRQIDRQTD